MSLLFNRLLCAFAIAVLLPFVAATNPCFAQQSVTANPADTAVTKQLKEISVISAKPLIERKTDRTIYNVENSISTIGGDAIDALKKAPGVMVNNDNISIAGKSAVKLMLNDRLLELTGDDLIEFLKTLTADDISRIEIITNPSAMYDAGDNAGIINIVLKKSRRQGFSGNEKASFAQNNYSTGEAGGSLNYNNERFTVYSSFNFARGAETAAEHMEIDYATQRWTKHNSRRIEVANGNAILGADYKLSKKTTLGVMYNRAYSAPNFAGHITNPIYEYSGRTDSVIHTETHTIQHSLWQTIDANLLCKLGGEKKLTIDAAYFTDLDNKNRNVLTSTYPGLSTLPSSTLQTQGNAKQQIDVYTLKADLKLPYKFATLMLGGKLSFIDNNTPANYYNVVNNIYYPDPSNTDHFVYTENTQALYASTSKELAKWSFQGGLRGEYTETTGDSKILSQTTGNNYFELFPTAYIGYKENEDNTFSANYGRRIERPGYWSSNPFKYYSTPYYYQEGNPFLQPAFSNNVELSHSYKDMLATTLFLSHTTHGIDNILNVDNNTNILFSNYYNSLTVYTYGLTETITLNKLKWLESNSQATVYHTDAHSSFPGTTANTRSFSCNLSTDNTIIFNHERTIMAEVNFFYQFPEVEGILINGTHYRLDAGIKLMTPNKKWMLAVNATDILRTETFTSNTSVNGVHQYSYGYYDTQGMRVNVLYKFGTNKTEPGSHMAGNEDEAKRAR